MTTDSGSPIIPTNNTEQATAAAPTLHVIHALLWKLYDDLQQLRARREQLLAKHAGEFLVDALAGREFDRTRLDDMPSRDEEALLETAIDELTRRHRPAIVSRIQADVETARAERAAKIVEYELVTERRQEAIARYDEDASIATLREAQRLQEEIEDYHEKTRDRQPAMELSGHPNEILNIARNDPYCGVNPRALHEALVNVEQVNWVEIVFDSAGQCTVGW